jgi:hypothetical protein
MNTIVFAAAAAVLSVASPSLAFDTAPAAGTSFPLREGGKLTTADHRRFEIFEVEKGADGSPYRVSVLDGSTVAYVPASTITSISKTQFTTTMTSKDVLASH